MKFYLLFMFTFFICTETTAEEAKKENMSRNKIVLKNYNSGKNLNNNVHKHTDRNYTSSDKKHTYIKIVKDRDVKVIYVPKIVTKYKTKVKRVVKKVKTPTKKNKLSLLLGVSATKDYTVHWDTKTIKEEDIFRPMVGIKYERMLDSGFGFGVGATNRGDYFVAPSVSF